METSESEWIGVTPEEILKIKEAIEQLEKGKGKPHEEVMARFRNKLNLSDNIRNSKSSNSK